MRVFATATGLKEKRMKEIFVRVARFQWMMEGRKRSPPLAFDHSLPCSAPPSSTPFYSLPEMGVDKKRCWRLPSAYFEASARWPNIGRVKNELGRIKQRNVQMIPVYFHVVVDFNLNRFHTLMTIIFSLSSSLSRCLHRNYFENLIMQIRK